MKLKTLNLGAKDVAINYPNLNHELSIGQPELRSTAEETSVEHGVKSRLAERSHGRLSPKTCILVPCLIIIHPPCRVQDSPDG